MPDNTAPTTAAGLAGVFSGAAMTTRIETAAILRQLTEWRQGADIDPPAPREIDEAIDAAIEMTERLELAESSVAWHRRRWMALQMHKTKMREPERTIVCDILANGELMHPTVAGDRYAIKDAMEESK